MNKSFKGEVIADSSGKWSGNALRFATEEEAGKYIRNLGLRWTLVEETRVVPSEDEVTHFWDGFFARPISEKVE